MPTLTMDKDGRITIPKWVRDELTIRTPGKLNYTIDDKKLVILIQQGVKKK